MNPAIQKPIPEKPKYWRNMDGAPLSERSSSPQSGRVRRKPFDDDISSNDERITLSSSDDVSADGDLAKSRAENDNGDNDGSPKITIAQNAAQKMSERSTIPPVIGNTVVDINALDNPGNKVATDLRGNGVQTQGNNFGSYPVNNFGSHPINNFDSYPINNFGSYPGNNFGSHLGNTADYGVGNDAGNDVRNNPRNGGGDNTVNLEGDIPAPKFRDTSNKTRPNTPEPVEQDGVAPGAYDCREFARTIRGNWKIIAPTLTVASGTAAVALLTISGIGNVSGTQLSFGARWAMWVGGYLMTQAAIGIGSRCIPTLQGR